MEFLFAVVIFGGLTVSIVYGIFRLSKKRILKYIPSILLFGIALFLVFSARFVSTDAITSLVQGIWGLMLFFVGIIGIVAAGIMDLYKKNSKK